MRSHPARLRFPEAPVARICKNFVNNPGDENVSATGAIRPGLAFD